MKMEQSVIPAIIPVSYDHLTDTLQEVAPFASEVQVDIVDGHFVPFTSWPYRGSGSPLLLESLAKRFTIEFDLMIEAPERAIDLYARAGARAIVVHLESTDHIDDIIAHHALHTYKLGLSVNNDTPLEQLLRYLEHADYVQLMGIANIGSQGQPFDDRVLDRIRILRDNYPSLLVSIDGSVNHDTLPRLKKAGAKRFVSGSAILSADNPALAFHRLSALAA